MIPLFAKKKKKRPSYGVQVSWMISVGVGANWLVVSSFFLFDMYPMSLKYSGRYTASPFICILFPSWAQGPTISFLFTDGAVFLPRSPGGHCEGSA